MSCWVPFALPKPTEAKFWSAPPTTWLASVGVASDVTSITRDATRHSRYVLRATPCAPSVTITVRSTPAKTGQLAMVTKRRNQRVPVRLMRGIDATSASGPRMKSVAVRIRDIQRMRKTTASAMSCRTPTSAS
jgi:hypothetical protein